MGAFYGSAQVRSEDRDRVKAVAEDVARRLKIRMLIGPVLNGWIGIYPEGSGQDQQVGEALFQGLKTTVWHVLVHDDDILAYWLWHDGRLADSYHSQPGYFGEENRAEEEAMVGNPETLSQLVGGTVANLRKLLARDDSHPLASLQLDELQSFTGVRNLAASYEYLKEGETHGIKGRRQFVEVPGDLIEAEKKKTRQQRSTLASDRRKLQKSGLLLAFEEQERALAKACDLSDRFLVAWPDLGRNTVSFATYRAPWNEPTPLVLDTPGSITDVASDGSRQRVAMAAGRCVRVWDVAAGSWNLVAEIPDRDLTYKVAISADGKRVAHSSPNEIVVSDVASGKPLVSSPGGMACRAMAFHPSGEWLVVGGEPSGLVAVGEKPHWRDLYVGGKQPSAEAAKLMQKPKFVLTGFSDADFEAFEKQWWAGVEAAIENMRRRGRTEKIVERVRGRMEKELAETRSQFLARKENRDPEPPSLAPQQVMTTGFSRDGNWLWFGTDLGLRVYRWSDVPRTAGSELLEPTLQPARPFDYSQIVHAVAEEIDGSAIVFAGVSGRLLRLELSTGRTHELARVPGEPVIWGLTMSADGKTLGLSTRAKEKATRKFGLWKWHWQVWDYSLLRRQAGV